MPDKSEIEREILPDDAVPVLYTLELRPDLDKCVFSGKLEVSYDVEVACSELSLNAKELCFNEAYFETSSGEKYDADSITFKPKSSVVTISFGDDVLPVGEAAGKLVIPKFDGILNDQMCGFYQSNYVDTLGTRRRLAVTQFEAIDARRCFPCVDEPGRKARFKVTIIVPDKKFTAFSNMPEVRKVSDEKAGTILFEFAESPKMSTYLLAFLVGELDYITKETLGEFGPKTTIRCMSVPGKAEQLAFSLDVGARCLEFYNEFFGIPYPLPKLDMAAIPDFAAGAMENWGFVTYREIDLLCDLAKVSTVRKQRVASVVTHELAHQWFGNLVTMEWWNDLWLNEGFANFMQTFSADALFPEWKIWESFVCDDQAAALRLDSLRSSHPIQVPIPKAEQVDEIFDAISYCKGGSVCRMIFATLGKEKFREGLALYMDRHKYGNTQTFDLWAAWEEVSGKPIGEIMKGWTEQMGYPVLTVTRPDPLSISVSQKWYLANNSVEPGDEEKVWTVPILLATNNGYEENIDFLREKTQTFKLPAGSKFVKVNAGQFVPVRVLYDGANLLEDLAKAVEAKSLCAEDRIGLLQDTMELCRSGHLTDPTALFYLLRGFANEDNSNVWCALKVVIDGLEKVMAELETAYPKFVEFVGDMIRTPAAKLGWDHADEDDDLTKQLRGVLIGLTSTFDASNPAVLAEAETRYDAFVADRNTSLLPDDYKRSVFCVLLQNRDHKKAELVWEKLAEIMKDPQTQQAHRLAIYSALGYVSSAEYKRKTLEETYGIKIQDFFYPMTGVSMSGKAGSVLIFDWMRENFDKIKKRIAQANSSLLQHVVATSCSGSTFERADQTEAFFKDRDEPNIQRTLKQVCEKTRVNAGFLEMLKTSELSSPEFWAKMKFERVAALKDRAVAEVSPLAEVSHEEQPRAVAKVVAVNRNAKMNQFYVARWELVQWSATAGLATEACFDV
eukprot:CAMPEP_0178992074 /NCGR_PEP_ID=MMETSP0795-20121207/5896_1 /TAXON_ID=88552 /ORGANISM="Amoebophrya sp., Strain Ameob2" /LENGTH=956 /DNA_ID=CAMNT_0020683883 /DNA_START=392 /DNA_END=3262 /DNA_ORIENTATION=+